MFVMHVLPHPQSLSRWEREAASDAHRSSDARPTNAAANVTKGGERFSLSAFCGVGGAKWGAATANMAGEVLVKLKILWLHSARTARFARAEF